MKRSFQFGAPLCAMFFVAFAVARGDGEKFSQDEAFVVKAASCGVASVKFSEYAEKMATNADVKSFAQHVAKEHAKLNKELGEKSKNVKLAVVAGLEKDMKEKFDRLSKLSGTAFDREYMKQCIEGHQDAIKLFEGEMEKGTDADLKAFAREALPKLRSHLKKARTIADELK